MIKKILIFICVFSSFALAEVGEGEDENIQPTTLYDQGGNVLPDDPNSPEVNWSSVGKEGNSRWRGVGMLGDGSCTVTLFKIPQCNDPKKKAQVLTNGHCNAKAGSEITFDMFHNANPKSRVKVKVNQPVYSSTNRFDMAVLELDQSYESLLAQGIEAKRIAQTPLRKDKKYDLLSIPSQGVQRPLVLRRGECDMGDETAVIDGAYVWPKAVGFSGCSSTGGASGSGLFKNDEIAGILNSGNFQSNLDRSAPCDIGACTYDGQNNPQHKMMNFGLDVTGLHKCYENCTLKHNLPGCPLPDPNTEFEIVHERHNPGNWTSTLNAKYKFKSPYSSYQVKVCIPGSVCDCKDPSGYGPPREKRLAQANMVFFQPSDYLPNVPATAQAGAKPNMYLFCFRGQKPDGTLEDVKNITSYPIYHYQPQNRPPLGGGLSPLLPRRNR